HPAAGGQTRGHGVPVPRPSEPERAWPGGGTAGRPPAYPADRAAGLRGPRRRLAACDPGAHRLRRHPGGGAELRHAGPRPAGGDGAARGRERGRRPAGGHRARPDPPGGRRAALGRGRPPRDGHRAQSLRRRPGGAADRGHRRPPPDGPAARDSGLGGRVKVLQQCIYFPPEVGGLESHAYYLCRELVRMGHHVTMVTSLSQPGLRERDNIGGVEVVRKWFPRKRTPAGWAAHTLATVPHYMRLARHADILHAQTFASAIPGMRAKRKLGLPLVITLHTSHFLKL